MISRVHYITFLFIVILLVLSPTGCSDGSNGSGVEITYDGEWVKTTGSYTLNDRYPIRFDVDVDSTESIEVFSNQAYVFIDFSTEGDSLLLRYSGPADMGRGGMSYSWDNYSNSKPVAIGHMLNADSDFMYLEWRGFQTTGYDKTEEAHEVNNATRRYGGVYRRSDSNKDITEVKPNTELTDPIAASFLFSKRIYLGQAREDTEYVLGRPHDVNRDRGYVRHHYRAFTDTHILRYDITYKAGIVDRIRMDIVDTQVAEAVTARAVLLGAKENSTLLKGDQRSYINELYFRRMRNTNLEHIVSREGYTTSVMYHSDEHPYSDRIE